MISEDLITITRVLALSPTDHDTRTKTTRSAKLERGHCVWSERPRRTTQYHITAASCHHVPRLAYETQYQALR